MQNIDIFEPFAVIVALFYLVVLLFIAKIIRDTRYHDDPTRKYFLPALSLKLFGGFAMAVYYVFIVGGGDTISYYKTTMILFDIGTENPEYLMKILTFEMGEEGYKPLINANRELFYRYMYQNMQVSLRNEYAFSVVRLTLPITFFTYGSYLATNLITSFFSFLGVWALYRMFYSYYPKLYKPLAYAVLFLPSLWFWGSGILKDSWTIGALGMLTYAVNIVLIKRKFNIWLALLMVISGYIIFSIKPYILLSYIAFMFLWIGISAREQFKGSIIRFIAIPFFTLLLVAAGGVALTSLSQLTKRYSVDKVLDNAQRVQQDLSNASYYEDGKGSTYNIGTIDPTVTGILALFPAAVGTTFFRPFLWEVRNPAMVLSSLESILFLLLTFRVLFRVGLFRFFGTVWNESLILFSFGYSITFAFMVGLTSGNFGNLVRYKIPCLPFFLAALFIIEYVGYTKRKEDRLAAEGADEEVPLALASNNPSGPTPNASASLLS